jgi:hypothetical protein
MFLDMADAVDAEVYRVLRGFRSPVECKNFLLSAVLYYSRSPLVVSSNALVESLDRVKLGESFAMLSQKLDAILLAVSASRGTSVVSGDSEAGVSPAGGVVSGEAGSGGARSVLGALKQSFKV